MWSLVGSLVYLGAVANAADLLDLEISVVFPRNETYAPTDRFPVVLAFQNAKAAKNLELFLDSFIRTATGDTVGFAFSKDLTNENYSSEPYFVDYYRTIDTEGPYDLLSVACWRSCSEDGDQVRNDTLLSVSFTIQNGGQQVDLVADTANDKTCSAESGATIHLTNQTYEFPDYWEGSQHHAGGTCLVSAMHPLLRPRLRTPAGFKSIRRTPACPPRCVIHCAEARIHLPTAQKRTSSSC